MRNFLEFGLLICVGAFNFYFFKMWHLVNGKWYRISPTWKWAQNIRDLKRLAETAESIKIRKECLAVLKGLYIIAGYLTFIVLLEIIT